MEHYIQTGGLRNGSRGAANYVIMSLRGRRREQGPVRAPGSKIDHRYSKEGGSACVRVRALPDSSKHSRYLWSRDRGEAGKHEQDLLPDSAEELFGLGLLVFISGAVGCVVPLDDDN